MEEEIWKDIPGYEGKYQVSNIGRVRSLDYINTGKTKVMVPHLHYGYYQILLFKGGKMKCIRVHQLVARAFIPNPENKPCIDHINAIKTDNRVENLRWCTYKENSNNPITKPKLGKCFCKPVIQMDKNGTFIREWPSATAAAAALNIKRGPISACCLGKSKISYGYLWKFKHSNS